MADPGLQTLLSTKAAFDLGLISEVDFERVRSAYVRAQQIKTAVDVGLLTEEDFASAKAAFLRGISEAVSGVPGASPALPASFSRPSSPMRASRPASAAPPSPLRGASDASAGDVGEGGPPASGAAAFAALGLGPGAGAGAGLSAQSSAADLAASGVNGGAGGNVNATTNGAAATASAAASAPPGSGAATPNGGPLTRASLPAVIPKIGGFRPKQSGTSMSGIVVAEEAVDLFYVIRSKATYSWATWKLDQAGTSIVIDLVGPKGDTFAHFLAALPETDCRYGIFDYASPTASGTSKLVFLNWSPDAARIKSKMMYASSKDFFKGHLDGVSVEFQASELDDITEAQVAEAVAALKRV